MNFRIAALISLLAVMPAMAQTPAARPVPATRMPPPATAPTTTAPTPVAPTAKPMTSAASGTALVDVNSADAAALDALPGVGPARAKNIIAGRPWTDKHELVTRKALPANVFANIEGMIALVNVNTASATNMAKILPNVGAARSEAIVKSRPYAAPQDLVTKGALTQGVFDGIKGMVTAK